MIIVGLTGSIGMGKSTTAGLFADEGVPVNDADKVVHELYRREAVQPISEVFPDVVVDGIVDRQLLSQNLAKNPANFKILESIVHPLVRAREQSFLDLQRELETPIVVLDIPLLFETGGEARMDKIVVVSCAAEIQRQRVLSRPGMTPDKFETMLSRQMPDAEKRARADYVINTGHGIDSARAQVKSILGELSKQAGPTNHA
ncbi:dephospho-CoA kinase [Rhizobium sp. 'Codium 1']|uniref:dephospho-CoA kinase n=1 Tax=Rhizobium sp. 'Codium 1' TaxID=2940484 RepID=UPI001E31122B|nr:dephospho-CoA kinase [Rhizobium sp. 'Codium 1']MCC8933227.1 dephospho-CoA kinase [Rhizobium sp. 'Codium 1']